MSPDFEPVPVKYYFEKSQKLKFEVKDSDKGKPTKVMGSGETTMSKVVNAKNKNFELVLQDCKGGKLCIHAVVTPKKVSEPSLMDYLTSGWHMNLSVAIDYTASNGDPEDDDCLHKMGPTNQYEQSIAMIGGILQEYDTDKLFPVYGFGGKPQGQTQVNHCFPLTGDLQKPFVQGVE